MLNIMYSQKHDSIINEMLRMCAQDLTRISSKLSTRIVLNGYCRYLRRFEITLSTKIDIKTMNKKQKC